MPEAPRPSATASGKVILLGEHAVVFGVPAIVAGLDRGAKATAVVSDENRIFIDSTQLPVEHELYRALDAAREVLSASPVELRLSLDMPAGSGLGASAALGVAASRAVADTTGVHVSQRRIGDAADSWEQVFHGNASGVDRAAAQFGGVLRFLRGEEPEPVALRRTLPLVVAVAGPPANTKEMVENVARLKASNPAQFEKNLTAIRTLVDNALPCLRAGDLISLGKLMDLNHMLLSGWMLSTEGIENACAVARSAGALGAKLTGSGGGGCVVALCESPLSAQRVEAALNDVDIPAFACSIEATAEEEHHHEH